MKVDQKPQQFGDRETWMGVVELHRDDGGRMRIARPRQVPLDHVLQRSGDEEIFLPQPQFPARGGLVIRIEEFQIDSARASSATAPG